MVATLLASLVLSAPPALTVRVDGEGYLRFAREGRILYAKSARLVVSGGRLAHQSGAGLMPSIPIPRGTESIRVDLEGNVTASATNKDANVGRVVLAVFANPASPKPEPSGFLVATARPRLLSPGEESAGVIRAEGATPAGSAKRPSANEMPVEPRAEPKHSLRITVRQSVELSEDRILLGTIADIEGSRDAAQRAGRIDLGPTPVVGVTTRLFEAALRLRLKSLEPDIQFEATIPAIVEIHRKGQVVTHTQFVAAAREAVKQQTGVDAGEPATAEQPPFRAPMGALELKAEALTRGGGLSARIAVFVEGKRLNSRTIQFTGSALPSGVRAGEPVKVLLVAGLVVGEIAGRAKTAAFVGQSVEVTVSLGQPGAATTHVGIVKAPGIVEVKL